MQSLALRLFAAVALSGSLVLAGNGLIVVPGATNSYDAVQAPVLKVYTAKDGEHRFIAYVVRWKDSEVIVSDPLAKSDYKVGDTISFLAQKITVENKGSASVGALVFTLGRPPNK